LRVRGITRLCARAITQRGIPAGAPFVDVILNTILLTITAAGSYNVAMKFASKIGQPK
jgi:hypothetical protein